MTIEEILKLLLVAALLATVGALVLGLFHMFKNGKKSSARSNTLMRLRILFQGLAIFIFSALLFLRGH